MKLAICLILAIVGWLIATNSTELSAQVVAGSTQVVARTQAADAPAAAPESEPREMSLAEARELWAAFVASTGLGKPRPEPKEPEWFPLDPKSQEWVDQVLAYWELRSNKVKTLEFTFQQWDYDPSYMPNRVQRLQAQGELEKLPFARYSTGVMKYAAPDQGLFRVDKRQTIRAFDAKGSPQYSTEPSDSGIQWITNGKRFILFDAIRKDVVETDLPAELQGQALRDRLPFSFFWEDSVELRLLFGVSAEKIKDRFWIRPLQAPAKGEYCLEFVPKSKHDAAHVHSLQVVLDEAVYLPIRMLVFESDYSPAHPHRTAYKFDNRNVDDKKFDFRVFNEVQTPLGWRRIVRDANGNIVP